MEVESIRPSDIEAAFEVPLSFLRSAGFVFNGTKLNSSTALGEFVTLSWSNTHAQRMLSVRYFRQRPQAPLAGC